MTEHIALRQPLSTDLKPLSQLLRRGGLPHRIVEQRGEQLVWVASEEDALRVQAVFSKLEAGELDEFLASPMPASNASEKSRAFFRYPLKSVPMVMVILGLSIVGALIAWVDTDFTILPWLSFYQLSIVDRQLVGEWPAGQLWRLVSPIFLHFSLLHIAFNGLWLWELGGMIERRQGHVRILGVTLLVGAGSNIAQAMAGMSLFGGLSGVIYGLLGYVLAWNKLRPSQRFPLVPGVAVVMIIWLLLCIFGFSSLLGFGDIANTAHVSGLLLGLLLGGAAALLDKRPAF